MTLPSHVRLLLDGNNRRLRCCGDELGASVKDTLIGINALNPINVQFDCDEKATLECQTFSYNHPLSLVVSP